VTLIELIWTITPALILIAIAFPSFRLLYLLDEVTSPTITIKVTGFLTNGLKSCILNKIKDTWIYIPGKKNIIHQLYKLLLIIITIIEYIQKIYYSDLNTTPTQVTNNDTSFYIKKKISSIPLHMSKLPSKPGKRGWHSLSKGPLLFSQYNVTWSNTLAFSYYTKQSFHTQCRAIKRIGPHNLDMISVLFGLLLGDGYAQNRSGEGVRISIKQSSIHKEYLFSLYEFFLNRGYTRNSEPRLYNNNKVGNKIYSMYEFYTYTFRSFVWIYKLFYNKGKKVVKLELQKYITPQALAVWIMSNGQFINGGLQLNTFFHTSQDIAKLISMLNNSYGLISSMYEYKKGFYRIEIAKESIGSLIAIVDPFIIPNMRVKMDLFLPREAIDYKNRTSSLTINRKSPGDLCLNSKVVTLTKRSTNSVSTINTFN